MAHPLVAANHEAMEISGFELNAVLIPIDGIYLVNDTPTNLALSFRHITNRRINFPKNVPTPY